MTNLACWDKNFAYISTTDNVEYVITVHDTLFGFGLTLNTVFKMWGKFLKNATFETSEKSCLSINLNDFVFF